VLGSDETRWVQMDFWELLVLTIETGYGEAIRWLSQYV